MLIEVNGKELEQMSAYKYLRSWLIEDGKSEKEVKARIALVKGAFWKLKELLRGNLNTTTRKRFRTSNPGTGWRIGGRNGTVRKSVGEFL